MFMSVCLVYLGTCVPWACVPWACLELIEAEDARSQKRVSGTLGNGVRDGYEAPHRCCQLNPGHLPEWMLLAIEPALQHSTKLLYKQNDRYRICCSIVYGAQKWKINGGKEMKLKGNPGGKGKGFSEGRDRCYGMWLEGTLWKSCG